MKFEDNVIRGLLQDFRIDNGKDPSVIRMPLSCYYGYMHWLADLGGWAGLDPNFYYGIPIKFWNMDKIGLEDLTPVITWDSAR